MNVSLINHPRGYGLSAGELCVSLPFLTGTVYAYRHLELGQQPNASKWHWVVVCIECFPVLGVIVALIEWALFRCGCFDRVQIRPSVQSELRLDPTINSKLYIDALKAKETAVLPFVKRTDFSVFQENIFDDVFFNTLQHAKTGEEFIKGLQQSLVKPANRHRWAPIYRPGEEENTDSQAWPDLIFYFRPALYWAIQWQNLPFIESILQSQEGAKLLNRSYSNSFRSYREVVPPQPGFMELNEYPIHQAVRLANSAQRSFPMQEAAGKTDIATRIVLRLLELSANVNQADGLGRTPLFWALAGEHFSLAKLLIQAGGTVKFTMLLGQTAQVLSNHSLHQLAQLYHDSDKEVNEKIRESTSLLPVLSSIVVRYLY